MSTSKLFYYCGHGGEEKNSQLLPGLETLIIQPIPQHYTNELPWLLARNHTPTKTLQ
jgi:hypothetical protein